ncbi:MAG: hypothetical protein R3F12_15695 [Lysobacteraceae bacterium]
MAQALMYGKDLSRDLITYMESLEGQFFARGGIARSDTVPALLTPGEYVVNRATVQKLGVGFFDAINRMTAPAKALAGRAMTGVQGFATGGFVAPTEVPLARPVLTADTALTRTVRVELAAGGQSVVATLDAINRRYSRGVARFVPSDCPDDRTTAVPHLRQSAGGACRKFY